VDDLTISSEAPERLRIGPVRVGVDLGTGTRGHDPAHELPHGLPGRLGVGPSVAGLEAGTVAALAGPHRAASTKLRLVEAIDEVGAADEDVEVEGPVVAGLGGAQAIEDQGLGGHLGAETLVKEQAVAAETLRVALQGGVGGAELVSDLAQGRAAEEAPEEGDQEVAAAEPIGRGKGL
jgi:hypothetical protein